MGANYSWVHKKTLIDNQKISLKQTAKFIIKYAISMISILIASEIFNSISQLQILDKIDHQIDKPSITIPVVRPLISILLSIASYFIVLFGVTLKIVSLIVSINYENIRLIIGGIIFCFVNTYYETKEIKFQTSFNIILQKNTKSAFVMTEILLLGSLAICWVLSFGDLTYLKQTIIKNIYFHFAWNTALIYLCWNLHNDSKYPIVREQPSGKIVIQKVKRFSSYNSMEQFKRMHKD